jgi:hypothetical protein
MVEPNAYDRILSLMTNGLPPTPKRYELRCHPDVFLALKNASADAAAEADPFTPSDPALYGAADIVVRSELGSGGWELWADGERVKSGRLGDPEDTRDR